MTPAVYLHGFASGPSSTKARCFRDVLEAAQIPVTIPDLAQGDFENLTISSQLQVLERTIASRHVDLIGSSMGGWLAALFAARHRTIRRLVLLAPAFGFNVRWPERLGASEMERWRRDDSLEVYHYGDRANRRLRYRLIEDAANYEDYPEFTQPALIFHGAEDDVVPVANSEKFAAGHPNVRLYKKTAGHDLLGVLEDVAMEALHFLTNSDQLMAQA